MSGDAAAARYRDVFRDGEFRVICTVRLISMMGDQIARVALSVLVFDRTRSAALTALTFSLSFLPALAGPLLSGLADRYPRRDVMVVADSARAVLMGLMAIPAMPLAALFVLLVATELFTSPANAAQGAILADILVGDRLVLGQSARSIIDQVSQITGYAVGGGLAVLLTAHGALALNAASFVVSALVIRLGVRHRAAAGTAVDAARSLWASTRRGARLVWSDYQLRTLVALVWMIGLPVAAEGLAVPYAASIDPSAAAGGWLLASTPLGAVVGALALGRCAPRVRRLLMGPLAACAGLPLAACAIRPDLVVSCVLFGLSGVAAAYMVVAPALFVQRTPAAGRGQAIGLMSSGAVASQGIAVAIAGVAADQFGTGPAIGLAGAATVALGLTLTISWARASRPSDAPVTEPQREAV